MRKFRRIRTRPKRQRPAEDSGAVLSCVVAYNEFGGYCVPCSSLHRIAAQHVLAGDVWERDTLEYLVSRMGDGDVVHAGTYFGDFLPALSAACLTGCRVWAFEPNPENFRCASITVRINDLTNVHLIQGALGAFEGSAALSIRGGGGKSLGGASRIVRDADAPEAPDPGDSVPVRTVALDDVLPPDRHVSLVHLDVEGYEKEALAGARAILDRCRPLLVLESVPDDPGFSESVLSLGYAVAGRVDENTILSCGRG